MTTFHSQVNKEAPFHPFIDRYVPGLSVTDTDLDVLTDMGTTVVRVGVMMPGMFPDSPQLNVSYLDVIENVVDRLHERDIQVTLPSLKNKRRWVAPGIVTMHHHHV